MDAPIPEQAPPPYPGTGDAEKAYPPQNPGYPPQGSAPYPSGQPAGYPPQGQSPYPAGQPAGYPPQGQAPYAAGQSAGYPPQPAGAYPQPSQASYQQHTDVVVVQPHTVVANIGITQGYGDLPARTTCPGCQKEVTTQVSHSPGLLVWGSCLCMCVFGLWLCCCIPFCVDSMQSAIHTCPVCKYRIATYSR